MDHSSLFNAHINEAPQGDAMASQRARVFPSPGVPVSNSPQNGSLPISQKNPEISNVPSTLTDKQVAVVVGKGEYKPEYGQQMYDWFQAKEQHYITYDTMTWKGGAVTEKERRMPNPPPHFSEFARTIGVTWNTLKAWKKTHPEFAEAYQACEDIIQEFIVNNGLTGAYSGQFGIFAAKNLTKMRDVVVNKNENWNMRDVLDAIEKGINPNDQHDI